MFMWSLLEDLLHLYSKYTFMRPPPMSQALSNPLPLSVGGTSDVFLTKRICQGDWLALL